ncbi:uncharacterized protein JCM15063_003110 [Sporobolomyces koalae]|uniref:uncharacterized protein n=1 Tax=Sporobolomyces koalae TaxID=500713 RepID=UPI00317D8990
MSVGKKQRVAATRLPPEVLLDILAQAGANSKTLRSTALVHSSWRLPSQYLLHTELALPSRKIAKSFLQVPGRRCYARKLSLPISLDLEDCWEVLEGVEGLQQLTLVAQEGATGKSKFEIDLLEATSLKDLRSLRLAAPFSEPIHPSTAFTFAFQRLSTLSFKGPYMSWPIALLDALVVSTATSLNSLELDSYGSHASASRFFDALLPIAPQVQHVEVHGSDRSNPALLVFLTACTNLRSFTCWEATPAILDCLSPTVEALHIRKTYVFHNDILYDLLLTNSGVLAHLRQLRWSGITRATLKAQQGGFELLDDLAERGIETQFGAESVSTWYGSGLRA